MPNSSGRVAGAALTLLALAAPSAAAPPEYGRVVRETPGLLAHYRFDGGDATLPDAASRGRDGKLEAPAKQGAASAYGPLGRGADLGKGGWVRVPDLGTHDAVTVELWLNVARFGDGLAGIYAADAWQPRAVHLNLKADGGVEFALHGLGRYATAGPGTVPTGKWVHLVATYDRRTGEAVIYRNGRRTASEAADPRPAVHLTEAAVGAWVTGKPTRPLAAAIDEFAVYSAALTPGQVRSHYLAGKGVEETPVDFARQVRPLLAENCFRCHGEKAQKSGLRFDVRDSALRGGESGEPAVEPFDADASDLVRRVSSAEEGEAMPPDGRLKPEQVALLKAWVDQGAPWPDELAGKVEATKVATDHWSFRPVKKPDPPGDNAIDAFVLARLREKGLAPAPPADRRTLIRRLYLDLHGLPPSPEEIDAFLKDDSPDAWAKLVDAALASPRYGERLASHWLDVVRYGDTHGFEVNTPRDNAWPYRDYVIKAFNDDKPYDRFVREQIAGDQLGADAATGFLVAAPAVLPGQVGKDEPSIRQARADELHEVIVTVGAGVLGLTVGCARCHNHKFDPVSQQDYYKLQAVFAGLRYGDRPIRDPKGSSAKVVFGGTFTQPSATHRLYRGDPMQLRERVPPDVPAVLGSLGLESTTPESERRLALAKWLTDPKNPLPARVIVNRVWQHRFGVGLVATPSDFGKMGVPPTHPELLDWLAATLVEPASHYAEQRGRRAEEGMNWSLKKLTRRILLSNTYRQSSAPNAAGSAADGNVALLWRFPPRRLDMEPIRDSILAAAGSLDLTMGGPGFMLFKPNTNYVRVYDPKEEWGPAEWRRMVYAHRVRMAQDGVFGAFDCPDAGQPAPRRSRSTTALQALNLLNGSFVRQQADKLAERVRKDAGDDPAAQVRQAFRLTLGREPTDEQLAAATALVKDHGLPALGRALFNSNEFLFLP